MSYLIIAFLLGIITGQYLFNTRPKRKTKSLFGRRIKS